MADSTFGACLFLPYWVLYRGMTVHALILIALNKLPGLFVGTFIAEDKTSLHLLILLPIMAGWLVLLGTQGNQWYFGHARRQIAGLKAKGLADSALLAELQRRGGTHAWRSILVFGLVVAHFLLNRQ